jgi:hypothetical protein
MTHNLRHNQLYRAIRKMAPNDQKLFQEFLEETLPIYEFQSEITADITPIEAQINQEKIIGKVRVLLCFLRVRNSL